MKMTRQQLRKLIIESMSSNNVDFDIVHEGVIAGGTFYRYYVIVTYSPRMITANLGVTGNLTNPSCRFSISPSKIPLEKVSRFKSSILKPK